MGIEKILASRKDKEFCELPSETNSKSRKSRRRQRKMSPVQKLYELCKEVFGTRRSVIVPPADDVERIKSIGIFCLPPSGVIPLHNHPGMTVFSKILFGTMHIKSYDWVVDISPDIEPAGVRLAKVKVDSDFTAPCETSVLYPADGGNKHCFMALTPYAVLDVLCPPYSDPEERQCLLP
ncbi:cysteamine dioxygenase [Sarracenia purpurea var. burkii]